MSSELDPLFVTRRHFFSKMAGGLGGLALGSLLSNKAAAAGIPAFAPKAKRVIYLFMSGGPAQHDLFDDKPLLRERNGEPLPDSVRAGQRLTGMSGNQAILPLAGSHFKFSPYGKNGTQLSELLPHTGGVIDDLCLIRSMFTEAINHDPAMTFFQTGSQIAGRPSIGSWIHYGLGSINENLPAFVVLVDQEADRPTALRPPLGQRFPRFALSGRALLLRQGTGFLSHQSGRHLRHRPPRAARQTRRSQPPLLPERTRPRNRVAHRPV